MQMFLFYLAKGKTNDLSPNTILIVRNYYHNVCFVNLRRSIRNIMFHDI